MSHERKRQVETELRSTMNSTTSTFLDRPATNPEILQACRTLKIGELQVRCVWHDALLLNLHNFGIQRKCFQTTQGIYRNSSVCTKTTDGFSREIPVMKGVHQGNTFYPTLLNIFVNDIATFMTDNHSQV